MLIKDVLGIIRFRLYNIAASKDEDALIHAIYMGVSDLYNRFNLLIKREVVVTSPEIAMYELKSNDVLMLLGLYTADGDELKDTDVSNTDQWDYKQINFRSFILNRPKETILQCVYKASPERFKHGIETNIDLPDAMLDPLLIYVAYLFNTTITSVSSVNGRGGAPEADYLWKRYIDRCAMLENEGYKINLEDCRLAVQVKGFI